MAGLQQTVKVMTILVLFSCVTGGFGMKQPGICQPFCSGSDCMTMNRDRVDFQTAEEACRKHGGELTTFQSETDEKLLDVLGRELQGNLWIGLRLPAAACSDLSAPLRGYEWTSGVHGSFVPSSVTWKDGVEVCSPRCVSISNDLKWTERSCSDTPDGFLCRTKHKDACRSQEVSDPNVIRSSRGCSDGPCQQDCTDVSGGYICSCFSGYIPDHRNPRRCKLHCDRQKCPAVCERNNAAMCFCPEGFVLSGTFCEDIDECFHDGCDQECSNSFGSFACSCREGFILKDEVKCVRLKGNEHLAVTTPVVGFIKPAGNHTLKGSSAPTGGFLWIWVFLVVAVAVFVIVLRFYVVNRQKRREQNCNQQYTAAAVDNIEG